MPVSIAITRGPSPSRTTGSLGVTSRARSRPLIGGSASIAARASASPTSAGKMPPRIDPLSRMCRTSERVSTPVIAGMPQSSSQVSHPPSAAGESSRSTPERMTTPRACTESDSIACADTP